MGAQSIPRTGSDAQNVPVSTENSDAPTILESLNTDVSTVAEYEGAL